MFFSFALTQKKEPKKNSRAECSETKNCQLRYKKRDERFATLMGVFYYAQLIQFSSRLST